MVIGLVILLIGCLWVPALRSPGISLSFMCVGLLSDLIPAKAAGILGIRLAQDSYQRDAERCWELWKPDLQSFCAWFCICTNPAAKTPA